MDTLGPLALLVATILFLVGMILTASSFGRASPRRFPVARVRVGAESPIGPQRVSRIAVDRGRLVVGLTMIGVSFFGLLVLLAA